MRFCKTNSFCKWPLERMNINLLLSLPFLFDYHVLCYCLFVYLIKLAGKQMHVQKLWNTIYAINIIITIKSCQIWSKLTIKTTEWRHSGIFIVNFVLISTPFSSVSFVDFKRVNVCLIVIHQIWSVLFDTKGI